VKKVKKKFIISLVVSLIFTIAPFFLFNFKVKSNESFKEMFQQNIYEEYEVLPEVDYYDIYDKKSRMC
jgi:hypothetical protein